MTNILCDLETIGRKVVDHGQRLREDVDAGRMDHVAEALAAREDALRALADHVATLPQPLDPATRAVLDALREDDRLLREWMSMEKNRVASALASIQGRTTDPYREVLEGAAVLNERR